MARPLTYWDYIRVEDLCALQSGSPADADAGAELSNSEHLFIVVHQVFELWFKMILRELDTIHDSLARNPVPEQDIAAAVYSLDRIAEILRLSSDHFRVMETLTTRDYLGFRDKLFPASGFQSAQLREIEISLGLEPEQSSVVGLEHVTKDGGAARQRPMGSGTFLPHIEPSAHLAREVRTNEVGDLARPACPKPGAFVPERQQIAIGAPRLARRRPRRTSRGR